MKEKEGHFLWPPRISNTIAKHGTRFGEAVSEGRSDPWDVPDVNCGFATRFPLVAALGEPLSGTVRLISAEVNSCHSRKTTRHGFEAAGLLAQNQPVAAS